MSEELTSTPAQTEKPLSPGRKKWRLGFDNPLVRYAGWVLAILLLLLVLAGLFRWFGIVLPARFWQLVGLSFLLCLVVWWFVRGVPWYERRQFLKHRRGDLAPGRPEDEAEPRRAMQASLDAARRLIQRSPELESGRDPFYRIPWFLVIGADATAQDSLLRAASATSPFPPPDKATPQPWYWWFYKQMIAIETSSAFVCEANDTVNRGIWYQALHLLDTERSKLPLNGLLVLIPAQTLLTADPEALRRQGMNLRRLVDEAMEHLELYLPLYVIVTGLDKLAGFAAFSKALPPEVAVQATGQRLASEARTSAASSAQLETIFETVHQRLYTIRLAALRAESDPLKRKGIFEFVEAFQALKPGLSLLLRLLLEDSPLQRTPQWRGLYFTAAQATPPAFVKDLFEHFLPADQPLAQHTKQPSLRRWLKTLLGATGVLVLSLSLTWSLISAHRQDRTLVDAIAHACPELGQAPTTATAFSQLGQCARQIDAIDRTVQGSGVSFGIGDYPAALASLKARAVAEFAHLVLDPFDSKLQSDSERGNAGFADYLAITQRLSFLQRCRRGPADCVIDDPSRLFVFDPRSSLFPSFLAGSPTAAADSQNLTELYLASLHWQPDDALVTQQQRLTDWLKGLLRTQPLTPDLVQQWAKARYPPYTLAGFWLATEPANNASPPTSPQIDAAFRRELWETVLTPSLKQIRQTLPNVSLDTFTQAYFAESFRQWRELLPRFANGRALWQGRYPELINRLGHKEAPYEQLWQAVRRELLGLPLTLSLGTRLGFLGSGIKHDWTGIFGLIGEFFAGWWRSLWADVSVPPPPWLSALAETLNGPLRDIEPLLTKFHLTLQNDHEGVESYAVASELFKTKGASGSLPLAQDFVKMTQLLDKPAAAIAPNMQMEDYAAWSVVQGPARLILTLLVYRAGQYIQAKWQENVLEPVRKFPPKEQQNLLLGDNGKFQAFIHDWLQPFVSEKEKLPEPFYGVTLPLSPGYQGLLAGVHAAGQLPTGQPFFAGVFQLTRPSSIGPLEDGPAGTVFEVECKERVFTASSRAASLAEASVRVFWAPDSCPEARFKITFPELPSPPSPPVNPATAAAVPGTSPEAVPPAPPAPPPPPAPPFILVKTYAGADGFIRLIKDFRDGSETYSANDFKASYSAGQWQTVTAKLRQYDARSIRVYLSIKLSDEMERFLNPPAVAIPTQLLAE